MAKTLVALYDTFADAEHVVQELIADGFARSDIHMAFDRTTSPATHTASVAWDSAYEGATLIETLADWASPLRRPRPMRKGSVAMAPSWWSRVAMTGRSVAWRSSTVAPGRYHERTAQWRQEGWTGYDANGQHVHTHGAYGDHDARAQEQARAQTRVANRAPPRRVEGQQEVVIPVVEEDLSVGKREVERGHVRIFSRVTRTASGGSGAPARGEGHG